MSGKPLSILRIPRKILRKRREPKKREKTEYQKQLGKQRKRLDRQTLRRLNPEIDAHLLLSFQKERLTDETNCGSWSRVGEVIGENGYADDSTQSSRSPGMGAPDCRVRHRYGECRLHAWR